jgi:hypothetical protein
MIVTAADRRIAGHTFGHRMAKLPRDRRRRPRTRVAHGAEPLVDAGLVDGVVRSGKGVWNTSWIVSARSPQKSAALGGASTPSSAS